MRGLFITGTDTGVGKTRIACAILRELRIAGHRVGAFKPVCSGARLDANGQPVWDDIFELRQALGRDISDDHVSPQRFRAPLAPPIAAKQENRFFDVEDLLRALDWWRDECDILVVEGAGGLLCPVTESLNIADLAEGIGFPLVVVARLGLGTINHTLLTVEAAERRGLSMAGVVLNVAHPSVDDDPSAGSNAAEIAARCPVPVLGVHRHNATGWVSRFGDPVQLNWADLAGSQTAPRMASSAHR